MTQTVSRVFAFFQGARITVAGTGICGYTMTVTCHGSKNTSVRAIAVDTSGQLFIADDAGWRDRRVDTSGIIMTIGWGGDTCTVATKERRPTARH